MDKYATFYPSFDIEGRSAESIFRDLCLDEAYKELHKGSWKENFINRFGAMLHETPNVRTTAKRVLNEGLRAQKLREVDADRIYVHLFSGCSRPDDGSTRHKKTDLYESYTLTDAMLMNLFADRFPNFPENMEYFCLIGLYYNDKEGPEWGPHTQGPFAAAVPAKIIAANSIQTAFDVEIQAFWTKYADRYRDLLADLFLAAAVSQYKGQLLTDYGFYLARMLYYGRADVVKAHLLDVYKYRSVDVFYLQGRRTDVETVLLYIPGASQPFVELRDLREMKAWLARQMASEASQVAFRKHFTLYDRQDGTSFSGLDTILKAMGQGSSTWDPQVYICETNEQLDVTTVFTRLRDNVKQRMIQDGDTQIKSNSEQYRDYALNLCEGLISQLGLITMMVPEIGLPVNLALSLTALGLSSDIVLNGDSLAERSYGMGELISSSIFTAINLLPVFVAAGSELRAFSRPAAEIPALASQDQFIAQRFGLEVEELGQIVAGDPPRTPVDESAGPLRLVRLSDQDESLAVVKRVGGNLYLRLNPVSLEEIGTGLIAETPGTTPGKTFFLAGGKLQGGAPHHPYDIPLHRVWKVDVLMKKAAIPGKPIGKSYQAILDKLGQLHAAPDFSQQQGFAHELLEMVDQYAITHVDLRRLPALKRLREQIWTVLYFSGFEDLYQYVPALPNKGSGAARFLYDVALEEIQGGKEGLTSALIRYAEQDHLISLGWARYLTPLPADLATMKYAFNVVEVSSLPTEYFNWKNLPGLGSNNEQALRQVVADLRGGQVLNKLEIRDHILYIGHGYEEIHQLYAPFVEEPFEKDSLRIQVLFRMLRELASTGGAVTPESWLMAQMGTQNFLNSVIAQRLGGMKSALLFSDGFDFGAYDLSYGSAFRDALAALPRADAPAQIAFVLKDGQVVMRDKLREVNYFLSNRAEFQRAGISRIGFQALSFDSLKDDLAAFNRTGLFSNRLLARLLVLDDGESVGAYRQLLTQAREAHMEVFALGSDDGSATISGHLFNDDYLKAGVLRRASDQLTGSNFVVFAHPNLSQTTPGFYGPLPGLAPFLQAPSVALDADGNLVALLDHVAERTQVAWPPSGAQTLRLLAKDGRLLEMRPYGGAGYTMPTAASREALLRETVSAGQADELLAQVRELKAIVSDLACGQSGACAKVNLDISKALAKAQYKVRSGATVAYWKKIGKKMDFANHTATSVELMGNEYVVDGAHYQFKGSASDEPIIVLPPAQWAEEIVSRTGGSNPMFVRGMMGGPTLAAFAPPEFTCPERVEIYDDLFK